MDWNNILTFFISAGAITGTIVYIGKRIVDKSLDLAVEKYKGALARELATHKNHLDKVLFEHQIKFGKLHQDRLDVIKLFHKSLLDLELVLKNLTTTNQGEEWTRDQARENETRITLTNLKNQLEINQIYFSDAICKRITEIISIGHNILVEMSRIKIDERVLLHKQKKGFVLSVEELSGPFNKWQKLEKEAQSIIKEMREEMTNEFRILIGVD